MIFSTARQLVTASASQGLLADIAEGDKLAVSIFEADVRNMERLWAKTDAELVQELAEIRRGQRIVADERAWDEYEGYEVARYEVYAIQNNREAIADEAEQVRLISESEGPLTYHPFAELAVAR